MKSYEEVFDVKMSGNETPAYLSYMEGAKKIWETFHKEYEMKPLSIVKAQCGKNRRVEIYKNGVHIAGISIGLKDASLYVYDEAVRLATGEIFQLDSRRKYRIPNTTLDRCIDVLKRVL